MSKKYKKDDISSIDVKYLVDYINELLTNPVSNLSNGAKDLFNVIITCINERDEYEYRLNRCLKRLNEIEEDFEFLPRKCNAVKDLQMIITNNYE